MTTGNALARNMTARFCGYTTLRNLRFHEPFLVLYLLMQLDLPYVAVGGLLAYEKILVGILETPLGVVTDRWGRRRGLIAMFLLGGVAFTIYALAAQSSHPLVWLILGQTIYGVAEALRSGTHKAIMLDWLDDQGRRDEATSVISLTRVFSKTSTGVGALAGGVMVWQMGTFVPLFWAVVVPCLAGAVLMWSYPRQLEGEWTRQSRQRAKPIETTERWWPRFVRILSGPGLLPLLAASVLFETQVKLAMAYLQPYLAAGVELYDWSVIGGLGAVMIGVYYLAQGLAAGVSSSLGPVLERHLKGRDRSLHAVHIAAVICFGLTVVSLWIGVIWPGVIGLLLLACLQNARRPVFIARLNELMDPYLRATTISLENQARSWVYAAMAVFTGAIADVWGLPAVFTVLAGLVAIGLVPRLFVRHRHESVAPPVSSGR